MNPTDKQKRFAMFLLRKHGYSTTFFDARFRELGFTMRERSGRVADMDLNQCNKIIDELKDKEPE